MLQHFVAEEGDFFPLASMIFIAEVELGGPEGFPEMVQARRICADEVKYPLLRIGKGDQDAIHYRAP